MNKSDRELTSDEQHQIDLLVDGELGEVDRRLLLASFNARPGAWRRCGAGASRSADLADRGSAPSDAVPWIRVRLVV